MITAESSPLHILTKVKFSPSNSFTLRRILLNGFTQIFPWELFYPTSVPIVLETQGKVIFSLFVLLIFEKEKMRQNKRTRSGAKIISEVMSI